ncbi:hypothetical protein [Paracoccus ravus]|uniref:hypothetical protein n=1 Tax=Paracoccus ravus TaxID=2447760 RepID=UPI00106E962F|nr:hypothetical protein [Paracoccus ravus]
MIDILLLVGVALCALSVLMAIIAVVQTRAPRGAAIALVLGLGALFAGSLIAERPLSLETLARYWARVTGTEAPAPETAPAPEAAPAASESASAEAPATSQPSQ